MGIWSWMRKRGEARGGQQTACAPAFEQLELRLLLSADSFGGQYPEPCQTSLYDPAVVVALNEEQHDSLDVATSILTIDLNAPDGSAIANSGEEDFLVPSPEQAQLEDTSGLESPAGTDQNPSADSTATAVRSEAPISQVAYNTMANSSASSALPCGDESAGSAAVNQNSSASSTELLPMAARGPPNNLVSQVIFIDSAVDPSFQLKNAGLPGVAVLVLSWIWDKTASGRSQTSSLSTTISPPSTSSLMAPPVR